MLQIVVLFLARTKFFYVFLTMFKQVFLMFVVTLVEDLLTIL